jgi:hypothetical protein
MQDGFEYPSPTHYADTKSVWASIHAKPLSINIIRSKMLHLHVLEFMIRQAMNLCIRDSIRAIKFVHDIISCMIMDT